jgi:hypothetical protein
VSPHVTLRRPVVGVGIVEWLVQHLQAHIPAFSNWFLGKGTDLFLSPVQYNFQDASLVVLSERAISPSFVESQGEYGGASTIIEVKPCPWGQLCSPDAGAQAAVTAR